MDVDGSTQNFRGTPSEATPVVDAPFFGLIVPGQAVVTNFIRVDQNKFSVVFNVNPVDVEHLVFFLLPGASPPPCGVALYFTIPNSTDWRLIGSITCDKKSHVFRTNWRSVACLQGVGQIQIGISIENPGFITNLRDVNNDNVANHKATADVALNIGRNLSTFVSSFGTNIPPDVVDRWLKKFQNKYSRDPTFFLKG